MATLLLGMVAAVLPLVATPMLTLPAAHAAAGIDDYPTNLKNAPQDSLVDPWRFYNRECTSFVAWRLNTQNGLAFHNYYGGAHWGDASHWKAAAQSLGIAVDNSPTVGAVAWWAAGSAGSSRGHVAWVESVGDGSITIEEYNYVHRGQYGTRTITTSSSLWPSGFIHVSGGGGGGGGEIHNTERPAITGTAQVGVKLTSSRGAWSSKVRVQYQWLADGAAISGATNRGFTPTASELGKRLTTMVTAVKTGAKAKTVKSASTGAVVPGAFTTSAAPTVSGTPQVGVTLSATSGTWSPAGTYSYQWYADGKKLKGATASTFVPGARHLGKAITVSVGATAPGYNPGASASAATAAVAAGQFTPSGAPTISGTPQVDQPLTLTVPTFTPTGKVGYQWLADGNAIAGATGTTYTPTADDLHRQISAQVTVQRKAYQPATATSAATDPVAPGSFLNARPPAVTGTPQVGVALTADPGQWSPQPDFSYQWLVDGSPVPGATNATYTPTPADIGKAVSFQLAASRNGYLTAVTSSAATGAVAPGEFQVSEAPVVSGDRVVGAVLSATNGTWTPTPEVLAYQWFSDGQPLPGATGTTYQLTEADAGHRISVQVTATATGYNAHTASSHSTHRIVFGTTSSQLVVKGHAVVGRTLHAQLGTLTPTTATAAYRWFRGTKRIHGAKAADYEVRRADVGKRLHVEVVVRAPSWTSSHLRSHPARAEAKPALTATTRLVHGHVVLRLVVHAPGLEHPRGSAEVYDGKHRVGAFRVRDGLGHARLAHLTHGHHRLRVVYDGRGPQAGAHLRVQVSVP